MRSVAAWALAWAWMTSVCAGATAIRADVQTAPSWSYRVIATHPHDVTAFTEGLFLERGRLVESTGRYGDSMLAIRDLGSGRVLRSKALDASDFGEGVAAVGHRIFQLTWKAGIGYIYDFDLNRIGSFPVSGEGWGLTYDGRALIRSDGSSILRFHDPKRFSVIRQIQVRDGGKPVDRLNELEYVNERLYANVWLTNKIAVIDPSGGAVVAWLDLTELKRLFPKPADWNEADYVLNGIAYDARTGHFLVTGKCWPLIFEIAIDR